MLNKRKKRKFKRFKRIAIIVTIPICLILFFEYQAIPFQEKYIKTQAKIISNNAISDAVNNVLIRENYSYSDLVTLNQGDNGKTNSIETNSKNINLLKAELDKEVQGKIETVTDADVSIPLGAFTELSLLNNYGPKLKFDFTFVGSFSSHIESTFESAGINQTIHHIKLIVNTNIITLSPDYSDGIEYTTEFEIAQTILNCETPSTIAGYGRFY